MEKDVILSFLIGVVLVAISIVWKLSEVGNPLTAAVELILEGIRSLFLGVGLLFLLAALLMMRE